MACKGFLEAEANLCLPCLKLSEKCSGPYFKNNFSESTQIYKYIVDLIVDFSHKGSLGLQVITGVNIPEELLHCMWGWFMFIYLLCETSLKEINCPLGLGFLSLSQSYTWNCSFP